MKIKNLYFLVFFLVTSYFSLHSQEPDSLLLFDKLRRADSDTQKVNAYLHLAEFYMFKNSEKAMEFAVQAKDLATREDYKKGIANACTAAGEVNFLAGNYEESLENYTQSLAIFKNLGSQVGMAESLLGLGKAYYRLGQSEEALKKFSECLSIYEKLNNIGGQSATYINLGLLYDDSKSYNQAIEYYNKALVYAKKAGDDISVASCYHNLGGIYGDQEKFDMAIECFERSLKIKEKLGNKKGCATTLNSIGGTYYAMGNIDMALGYFEKANVIYLQLHDLKGAFPSCNNIGFMHLEKKNYTKALAYFDKAFALAKETHSTRNRITCLENLAAVHQELGNYKLATEYATEGSSLKDTLYDTEQATINAEMQTRFATEKKQQENEILNLQLKSESFIKTIFIIAAAFLFVLVFFIFRGLKQKQKVNKALEEKNTIIEKQKQTVENQKHIVEEQNKDITDSIRYAERIQNAIFPPEKLWNAVLPQSFVLFKPKDILSGDFYWIEQKGDLIFVAAADCTGHGVPGALISIVNYNLLNKAVLEKDLDQPHDILNYVNQQLILSLHQTYEESSVKDGMDISLCVINKRTLELQFAGANNPIYIIKDKNLLQFNGNKFPVGAFIEEKVQLFTSQSIQLQKNDLIYLFSDGYADQFGGPKGKKYKYQQLKDTFLEIQDLAMNEQQIHLAQNLKSWKGSLEQVDDVLVIGIRI